MAFPLQVVLRYAGGDHAPREQLVLATGAVGVEMGVEATLIKGLQPTVQGEILLPGVKLCAFKPAKPLFMRFAPLKSNRESVD